METKKNEIRYKTSDTRKMLGKFVASRVLRTWTEQFEDKDTGKFVDIERSEVILDKGTYIDKDVISQINFWLQEGSVKEIEVSNQTRLAFELANTHLYPFMAKLSIKEKMTKFLLHAQSIPNAIDILTDYVELHYEGGFSFVQISRYEDCIILIDNLKEINEIDYITDTESIERLLTKIQREVDEDKKEETPNFYKIEAKIYINHGKEDEDEKLGYFIVRTTNAERAIMLINKYLKARESERIENAKTKGEECEPMEIRAAIEQSSIVPVSKYIPLEFSEAYSTEGA